MNPSFAFLRMLCALGLGAFATIHLAGESAAQQGQGDDFPDFATFDLFQGDTVEPNPDALARLADAIRGVQVPGDCPLGRLRIRTPEGDQHFQEAVAAARRDAVLAALDGRGVDVAGRLFVESTVFGDEGGHDVAYEFGGDDQPPTLTTTSRPPAGTKVRPGQQIIVRVAARDDADRWRTGIKTIQLVADSEGGRFIAAENYGPCAEPLEKRVQATYAVPADPPPIVRLTALTEDHVGLMDTDTAQFPTGDWYGTLTWTHRVANPQAWTETTATADLSLEFDGTGGLTGAMTGSHTAISGDYCRGETTTGGGIRAELVGSYTPGRDAMTIRVSNKATTPMVMSISCGGPPVVSQHAGFYEFYEQALLGLRPTGDGGYQSSDEQERPCEAGSTCTTRFSLIVRRARN